MVSSSYSLLDEGLSNLNPNFPSTDDDIVINTDSSVDIFADINDGAIVNQAPLLNAVNVNDKEPGKHHNQKPLPREWNPSLVHFKPTEAAVIVDSSEVLNSLVDFTFFLDSFFQLIVPL